MKKTTLVSALALMILFAWHYALAQESWRAEFDEVCGKTDQSMTMKLEELKEMVARCDKLKTQIEASDSPQKKVLLKRLEMCRNLYSYMVEAREKEKK